MKYLILLGDGMADWPIEELGGKTPLEAADTQNMDKIAAGLTGLVKTVPENLKPGSDVANLSVLGYDPNLYYTGRAPLEAVSKDVPMGDNDVAYRCNFVKIENGIMADFAAGHVESIIAHKLIDLLNEKMSRDDVKFYAGVSYRNLMVWHNGKKDNTTPPHDISDKPVRSYLPNGGASAFLKSIMNEASDILKNNNIYKEANAIWLWGEGKKPSMPLFTEKFNKTGCMVSAVDLMIGIGKLAGMETPFVPNVTAFIDTNYEGKIEAAFKSLKHGADFAYVHVEATDEAGHMGDLETKIKAIELFDKKIVGYALKRIESFDDDFRIAVLPDHPTPIKLKTHTKDPVPFAIYDSTKTSGIGSYNEKSCANGIFIEEGYKFIGNFLFKS